MTPRVMRNSNLLKWANPTSKQSNKNGNRAWIHTPDALQRGHVAYLVKYLGFTEVDEPKGIEVVKEGIRKLTFNQQLRKSEGSKIPKVELTISIDGVAIQEPKTKRIMNQYPLHRISYCADDKGEKKFFSFIAKEQEGDQHVCFVFVSDKLAEEITLTIGQAFDLAYRRFLETSGKDLETHRHIVLLQQKVKNLESENSTLKQRLQLVSQLANKRNLEDWMSREGITELTATDTDASGKASIGSNSEAPSLSSADFLSDPSSCTGSFMTSYGNGSPPPPVPPRAFEPITNISPTKQFQEDLLRDNSQPAVGTKLQGLLLDDLEDDFNPRAFEADPASNAAAFFNGTSTTATNPIVSLSPPPKTKVAAARPRPHASNLATNGHTDGLITLPPGMKANSERKSAAEATDLFGMDAFSSAPNSPVSPGQLELESALGFLDRRILEMKDGFSRGLTLGNEDFSIESLDPLRN